MMHAVRGLLAAAVKALIEPPMCASLDWVDCNGYTALMICTFCDRSPAASLLIKAGAEVRVFVCFYGHVHTRLLIH